MTSMRRRGSLAPGGQIGRYVLLDKLGQGSFGLVFTARDTVLDRAVAIKVLSPEHQYDVDLRRRFLQEALASTRVVHPAIVTVHDFGTVTTGDGETTFIVLELLQGESLSQRLARGRLPIPWAIEIARQVASALECAHRAGVLHRDLKSENIHLVPDPAAVGGERVKVLDFGLAKIGPTRHTRMNTVFGTPRYMSPEQCRSATAIDARSDIYSLGCILFELLTGCTPFSGDMADQLEAHKRKEPPRATAVNPDVPYAVGELIARMLAKDPDRRPQTMGDLEATLRNFNGNALPLAIRANAAAPGTAAPGVAETILPTAASMIAMQAANPFAGRSFTPQSLARIAHVEFSPAPPAHVFGDDEMTAPRAHAIHRPPPPTFAMVAPTAPQAARYSPALQPALQPAMGTPRSVPLLPRPSRGTPPPPSPAPSSFTETAGIAPPPRAALLPLPAAVVAPDPNYHLAPHLPSLRRKSLVRPGIASAAIAFFIAALLAAFAARGHVKSAAASPHPYPTAPE